MKQLTCEMCGSNNLVKQDGMFVCQDCGSKYSVEEAKKMMVEGTVRVDNSHLIQNYLEMAERAYQSSNNAEVENYCNKIIEIDPNNYQALMFKGKAAGWQSTLQNNRFAEAINCFSSAISNAPDEEKDDLIIDAKNEVENLSAAIMELQGDRFEKWPDEDESAGLLGAVVEIIKALILFATSVGSDVIDKDELMSPVATQINNSVMNAWNNKIVPEYKNDSDGYPSDYAFKQLISRAGYCEKLLDQAIKLSDNDDEADIIRYKNLIAIHEYLIGSCSYEYRTVEVKGGFWNDYQPTYENRYCKNLELTDSAKSSRRNQISQYRAKIREIERAKAERERAEQAERKRIAEEEAQKRFEAYWTEHANEKVQLEAERDGLNDQIKALQSGLNDQLAAFNKEIASIPGTSEIANFDARIKQLSNEQAALGLFKGKEKKALQEQIDQVSASRKTIQDKMDSEKRAIESKIAAARSDFEKKAAPLQSRVEAIHTELTKAR